MSNQLFANGYALLVGVGADLPVTVKDAVALRDVLIDPSRAAYSTQRVTLLTETTATRHQILAAFDQIIEQVNQNPSATVIIYYSGHGGYIQATHEYFLVPYGYNPSQRTETAITGLEFTRKIEAIKSQKLIVLLDCCHAGGVPALKDSSETFTKSPVPPDLLNVLNSGSGRVVVASSRENEYSYTGSPYSVFTACLLEALQGRASLKQDGYARILDILSYLFEQVPQRASGSQHPFVNKVLDLSDNFPLCYYAGGSKDFLNEVLELLPTSTTVTPGQRRRLEQRQGGLQMEYDLRSEKLKRLREALATETDPSIKFKLEKQILEQKAGLTNLGEDLDKIEAELQ
ncbi:caspase family protein [Phormidesmis sp. 146-12]